MARQTATEIDIEAAEWAARADRGLTEAETTALEAWLAGDTRRQGAYGRLRAVALKLDRLKALGSTYDPDDFAMSGDARLPAAAPAPSRRRLLWAGGGAIAASVAGLVGVRLVGAVSAFETRLGEVKVLPLPDGSVMTLNTASRVRLRFSEGERRVVLTVGEALFDVAKDASRPFIVEAGGTQVRALGTSFTVRRLRPAPVEVLVREGVVEVSRGERSRPLRVAANTRAIASNVEGAAIAAVALAPATVDRELAWREGRIAFDNETLLQAADKFARYSETRIVFDDPQTAAEEISGLFQANDPIGFAHAVATSFNLRVRLDGGNVHLGRS